MIDDPRPPYAPAPDATPPHESAEEFPGGVGVTRLSVYAWGAPDGHCGGSPHLHCASGESYVVLGGTGRVQTLSSAGEQEHDLERGTVLWFTPGTVHRIINDSGDLDVLALMDNAGLPEAGDAVLTFPARVLADPDAYAEAAALPVGAGAAEMESAVRARRDLALVGYAELRDAVRAHGPAALAELHSAAAGLVRPRVRSWRALVEAGPLAQARRTLDRLERLAAGDPTGLAAATVRRTQARGQTGGTPAVGHPTYGMCGHLQTWDLRPRITSPVPDPTS